VNDIFAAALAFCEAGYSVVPAAADGSKAPAGKWQQYQVQRADPAQIKTWFANDAHDGFGLVCGTVSGGLEMLEFEGRAVAAGVHVAYRDALAGHGLGGLWKRVVSGYTETTPSGGMHILYRVNGAPRGNTRLASTAGREPLIETRGEAGFTIVAPSGGRTHNSGKRWQLAAGGLATIAVVTAEERDALWAVASLLDQAPPPPSPAPADGSGQDQGRPGDDFNSRVSWPGILAPHGWQCVRAFGPGAHGWRRPGKQDPGMSATTRDAGGLYVFSTSTPFEPEVPYTKFGAYTVLNHGGDHTAAARALRREGYGTLSERDNDGIADLIASPQVTAQPAWEPPALLGGHAQLPTFPVEAFPPWLEEQVAELARFTQTPCDLGASVALSVLSAAAGGRVTVEVRGSWREPVNLYTVAALEPGTRKSAVFAELTAPLLEAESLLAEQARPVIREAETQRKIATKDAEKAAIAATGLDDQAEAEEAMAEAIGKAQIAEAITVPVMPRLVADDITPESLASRLAEQGGRLAVLSAEGGIFSIIAGRYTGGQANLEAFLKGHSGDMIRVDRKGRPPEYIPRPALTLGLCVQPEVLRAIAAMPGFRGRGLLARILFSVPPDMIGQRKIGEDAIPPAIRDAYCQNVQSMTLTLAEWTDPAVLMLDPGARRLLLDAEREIEPRLDRDTGDLAGIVDWAAKHIGAVARLAGLLHLATHPQDGWMRPVSEETMQAALQAGRYYIAHALAAFDLMGVDQVLADARVLLRWIERTRPQRFTRRDAHAGASRSRFPKVGDLDAPLALLEQHGYIRQDPAPPPAGPGRPPSPGYLVHPDLATETTQYTELPGQVIAP
jgi:replicative DNA helicase